MTHVPWLSLTAAIALCACIDPLVSDEVERPALILPPGTELSELTDNPIMRAQIDRNDGIDGDLVELRSAFAHGKRIWYWDLGPASTSPIPLYVLVQKDDAGFLQTPQGNYSMLPGGHSVFDAVPGDPGYSPWWIIVMWPVTDKYQGEVIASFDAMNEAFREGLVGPSIMLPLALNCPMTLPDKRIEMVPDDPSSGVEGFEGFYKGYTVYYFGFDVAFLGAATVGATPEYQLRRSGGEPISEALRGVDMTHDGDLLDSNDLFASAPGDSDYTGMVQVIDAVVTDHDQLIDAGDSDARSDLMDAGTLFKDGAPDPEHLVALHPPVATPTAPLVYYNHPIWHPAPTTTP